MFGPRLTHEFRYFALAFLIESINQVTKPTAQQVSKAGPSQQSAQVSGCRPAGAARLRRTGIALPSAHQFRELISILVPCDGEEPQEGCHRRISAAHSVIPFARASSKSIAPQSAARILVVGRMANRLPRRGRLQVRTYVVAAAHPDFLFDARPFNGTARTWFHSVRKIGVPPRRNPPGHGQGKRRPPSRRHSRAFRGFAHLLRLRRDHRRQPVIRLLRTRMYEIAAGCKKSAGFEYEDRMLK